MKEEFIHFLWKHRLFYPGKLETTRGHALEILNPGIHNTDSGPDFSSSRIKIGTTEWAGNVEMHVKSSDWMRHQHQNDNAYNNLILHVVMEHDSEITDGKGEEIPVFEVRKFFDMALYYRYERIVQSRSWVPCEAFIRDLDKLLVKNWLNRLMAERLEFKSDEVLHYLKYFDKNWEQTLYFFMARNFGFKINSAPFGLLAQETPYKLVAKHRDDLTSLEAILFGQAGFLNSNFNDAYPDLLKREYSFYRLKYTLKGIDQSLWKFSRLRPSNFPTIRLAQFAGVLHNCANLMDMITSNLEIVSYFGLFNSKCSPYWDSHYRFDISSPTAAKNLGRSAIENLVINTIAIIKFVYGTHSLNPDLKEGALVLLATLPPEKNNVINGWEKTGITPDNAGDSQALIQLKKYYCMPRKCLNCAVGHYLLKKI